MKKRIQDLNLLRKNLPNSPVYAYLKEDYNRLQDEHEKLTHFTPLPLTEEETKEHINSIKKRIQDLNSLPYTNLNSEVYTYLSEDFNILKQEHKKITQTLPSQLKEWEDKSSLIFLKSRIQKLGSLSRTNLTLEVYTHTAEDYNKLKQEYKKLTQDLPDQMIEEIQKETYVQRYERPYKKINEDKVSALWYLFALFFAFIGGVIGYVATKEKSPSAAATILIIGIISSVIIGIIGLLILSELGILFP